MDDRYSLHSRSAAADETKAVARPENLTSSLGSLISLICEEQIPTSYRFICC